MYDTHPSVGLSFRRLTCHGGFLPPQIQMEKLASRHAISELFNWISLMENVTEEDEENLQSAVGSSVIQDYLQKYKVMDASF